jgi:Na+/proline symporter
MMQSRNSDLVLTSLGVIAVVLTGDFFLGANFGRFENPHPALFHKLLPLWFVLQFSPGLIIGLLLRRHSKRIAGAAYSLGIMINFYRFDGYGIARVVPPNWPVYFRVMIYNIVCAALLGAVLALIGQLIYRLTKGWSDRRARFR